MRCPIHQLPPQFHCTHNVEIRFQVALLRDDSDLLVPMERFPEPLANGNFLLLRCVPKVLNAFRRNARWREIFGDPRPMAFDEWHFAGEPRGREKGRPLQYLSSIYETWHEMLMTGELKPQPATRLFVQDAIIQTGLTGTYRTLDSFQAKVNLTWHLGRLIITRHGPCVCPSDVIPQPGIASCPQCVKNPGSVLFGDGNGNQVQLNRTLEVFALHFQLWKKSWRRLEYEMLLYLNGTRPPHSVIRHAVPDCLVGAHGEMSRFRLGPSGFGCEVPPGGITLKS